MLDTIIIGHISEDIIEEPGVGITKPLGGAVLYSSWALNGAERNFGVLTKYKGPKSRYAGEYPVSGENYFFVESEQTTSIKNVYHDETRETRTCTAISIADPFVEADLPDVEAQIIYLGGLVKGDFSIDFLRACAKRGRVAVDVQAYSRVAKPDGSMVFEDWNQKREAMPHVYYFKADAAETKSLTGLDNREEGAKMLAEWGSKEIVISHNSELLAYVDGKFYRAPFVPRNLSGRTGRGDTSFCTDVTERLYNNPQDAVTFAAALCSLKMETPGPFKGTRADVLAYIDEFY